MSEARQKQRREFRKGVITANFDRSFEFEKIGLSEKDILGGLAELADFVLGKLHLFGGSAVLS